MRHVTPTGREVTFDEHQIVVSKTDLKGRIQYGNELFIKLTGFTEIELLGAPHNIVRHPEMPAAVFKLLWQQLREGREVNAYVVNLAKDGSHYWVYANVTPSYDKDGKIIAYHSTRRKPTSKALNIIKPLYQEMLRIEKSKGVESSFQFLVDTLTAKGVDYDSFIVTC